jgi:succinate-acetate transporter protein
MPTSYLEKDEVRAWENTPSATDLETRTPAPVAAPAHPGASLADPGPLGLAAFALTTFMLSVFNAGLISDLRLEAVVLPVALFYGGLVQLLAGMWEFKKGNTFAALAFSSYGAFWLSFAALVKFVAPTLPKDVAYQGIGLFLLAWTIFTVAMTVTSIKTNGVLLAAFTAVSATLVFLTIGAFAQAALFTHIGGYLGLLAAALAGYGALAGVMNATWRRNVLPVFPARF